MRVAKFPLSAYWSGHPHGGDPTEGRMDLKEDAEKLFIVCPSIAYLYNSGMPELLRKTEGTGSGVPLLNFGGLLRS